MIKSDYQKNQTLVFKVLSSQVRLNLIEALRDGEKDVSNLCVAIDEEQTRVSHELRCLTVCGFVDFRRDGKRMIYSLNSKTVLPILDAADNHTRRFSERMKGCDMITDVQKIVVNEKA